MTVSTSLYELILNLLRDPQALEDFRENPDAYLASCGDFSSDDVKDALELIRDDSDDNDRDHNNTVHVAPPHNPPSPEPGESEHEAAVRYLNTYVTNNYIDDRDTNVDNSINQQIDNRGGIFDQDIDVDSNVASGDGAVAADDIEGSNVVTGDDNQVGDDNVRGDGNIVGDDNTAVTGDGNTTSFGDGDATSSTIDGDVTVGAGGGFATGGDVAIDNSDNSLNDSLNDESDNSVSDSGNVAVDASVTDSGNETTDVDIDDSFQDNDDLSDSSDTSIRDTGDVDITN